MPRTGQLRARIGVIGGGRPQLCRAGVFHRQVIAVGGVFRSHVPQAHIVGHQHARRARRVGRAETVQRLHRMGGEVAVVDRVIQVAGGSAQRAVLVEGEGLFRLHREIGSQPAIALVGHAHAQHPLAIGHGARHAPVIAHIAKLDHRLVGQRPEEMLIDGVGERVVAKLLTEIDGLAADRGIDGELVQIAHHHEIFAQLHVFLVAAEIRFRIFRLRIARHPVTHRDEPRHTGGIDHRLGIGVARAMHIGEAAEDRVLPRRVRALEQIGAVEEAANGDRQGLDLAGLLGAQDEGHFAHHVFLRVRQVSHQLGVEGKAVAQQRDAVIRILVRICCKGRCCGQQR